MQSSTFYIDHRNYLDHLLIETRAVLGIYLIYSKLFLSNLYLAQLELYYLTLITYLVVRP